MMAMKYNAISVSHEEVLTLLKKGETVLRVIEDYRNLTELGRNIFLEYKLINGRTHFKRVDSELPFVESQLKVSDMIKSNWVRRAGENDFNGRGVHSNEIYGSIGS